MVFANSVVLKTKHDEFTMRHVVLLLPTPSSAYWSGFFALIAQPVQLPFFHGTDQEAAATRIQAMQRRRKVRQNFNTRLQQNREGIAATKIQAFERGRRGRQKAKAVKADCMRGALSLLLLLGNWTSASRALISSVEVLVGCAQKCMR